MAEVPPRQEEILLTHFIVSDDVERSRRFYTEVLGGRIAFSSPGGPTNVALSNSWIVINAGGVTIQLVPLTVARSAPPPARRRAARRRSSVGGRVPVRRAAAACALWLVGWCDVIVGVSS